jgi:hypothetical protein
MIAFTLRPRARHAHPPWRGVHRLRVRLYDDRLDCFQGTTHIITLRRGRTQPNGEHGHVRNGRTWVRARRRWMREQDMFDPARLVFLDEIAANSKMVRRS